MQTVYQMIYGSSAPAPSSAQDNARQEELRRLQQLQAQTHAQQYLRNILASQDQTLDPRALTRELQMQASRTEVARAFQNLEELKQVPTAVSRPMSASHLAHSVNYVQAKPYPGTVGTQRFTIPAYDATQHVVQATADETLPTDDADDGAPELNETQNLYVPYVSLCHGPPHPTPPVTTSTLDNARLQIDPLKFLHPEILSNDAFSNCQRDALAYIRRIHLGKEAFFLSDGPGVGKGRMIAGAMLNHLKWNPGCKKYIIVTARSELEYDFERDLKAVKWKLAGRDAIPLVNLKNVPIGKAVPQSNAILFMTYATLWSRGSMVNGVRKTRLAQAIEWANRGGKEFSGVMAFDESHSASRDPKSPSSVSMVDLQNGLPSASVLYASATPWSSFDDLCSLVRLGIWGAGTEYENYDVFRRRWDKKSQSSLENLTLELASQGKFLRRSISLKGTKFTTTVAHLTEDQIQLHSRLCKWWTKLVTTPNLLSGRQNRAQMWASHLAFFKALMVSFRVDHCVQVAKAALDQGGSVVVTLIATGEAATSKILKRSSKAKQDEAEDALSDGVIALEENMRAVIRLASEEFTNEKPAVLLELEREIETFHLPQSPLDNLMHEIGRIGYGSPMEVTGRKGGYVKNASTGKWEYRARRVDNVTACKKFQSGEARIIVISGAGLCGISLHNPLNGANHHRTQIMFELPYQANAALQMLGRTHRADQASAPTYVLPISNLASEQYFASKLSRRAADLGACTTGDRRGANEKQAFGSDVLTGRHSGDGMKRVFASLNGDDWPKWCPPHESCLEWAEASKQIKSMLETFNLTEASAPKQFLGRMLGVPLNVSNLCMHLYESACTEAKILMDKTRTDVGVEDVCIGEKTKIVQRTPGGAMKIETDIGISFEQALKKALDWKTSKEHDEEEEMPRRAKFVFAQRRDEPRRRTWNVLAQYDPSSNRCQLTRPTGRTKWVYKSDFEEAYTPIKESQSVYTSTANDFPNARREWDKEFELTLTQCSHGPSCRDNDCRIGTRLTHSVLIPMPGTLNALSGHAGRRQMIRLVVPADNDSVQQKSVAVRIDTSQSSTLEAIEAKLVAEKKRRDALNLKIEECCKQASLSLRERTSASEKAPASAPVVATLVASPSAHTLTLSKKRSLQEELEASSSEDEDVISMCGSDKRAPRQKQRVYLSSDDEGDCNDDEDDGSQESCLSECSDDECSSSEGDSEDLEDDV